MNLKKTINQPFIIAIILFVVVFLIDIAALFNLSLTASIKNVRDLLVMSGTIFLLIAFVRWIQGISIYNKIKYILYSYIFIFLINYFYPFYDRIHNSFEHILFRSIASIVSLFFLIFVLALIRDLIFVQRKKGTSRNFNLLCILLIYYSFFAKSTNFGFNFKMQSPTVFELPEWINIVYLVLTILMIHLIVINSFKTHWVKFINKNEKVKTFLSSIIILTLSILLIIKSKVIVSLYSITAGNFLSACCVFITVYFAFSIIVILLHLPTAGVYDRKVKELSSLHNLSRNILGVFDLERVMKIITDQTIEVAGANYCWLLVKNLTSNKLELVAQKELPITLLDNFSENPTNELTEWVEDNKTALKIDRISKYKSISEIKIWHNRTGSLLGIPLISNEQVMGILFAVKNNEYGFLADDQALLTMFANNATVAIENARLVKTSLEREQYEQELKVAHEAQKKLLPGKMPEIKTLEIDAACITANEVGGDYYDFFQYDKSKLGVIIGDVSGKGAEAAFYMAEAKGVIESLGNIYSSPKELLIKANNILFNTLDNKTFISALYGIFDLRKKTFTFSRAGHCPLLYWSKTDNEVYLIEPPGLALGLDFGENFKAILKEEKITYKPDDIFVFITDGVTEARNSEQEEFEEQRLSDIVFDNYEENATAIKNAILEKIENFVGNGKQHDDLTMVVIKAK